MNDFERDRRMAHQLAEAVASAGGCAYYVGGFVRDAILGIENKDIDIEVHGLTPAVLAAVLDGLGERVSIGESFGVYSLKGYSLDIAMPRREKLRGHGHKDFDIFVDPFTGTHAAAMRRDFTMNALMQNILTGEIVDEFGGVEDIRDRTIRHVNDETFPEDPLRVLRGAQFAARFGFSIAPETTALCRTMDLSHLARERVLEELKKAMLKAATPSIFFEVLRSMDQLDCWFPEAAALIGIKQNPRFHAEGDVWNHTMLTLDAAAAYRNHVRNPFAFMLGALIHDFGKAVCTEEINGVIHAYRHEVEGLPLSERFLRRLTDESELIRYALNLAEHHMRPNVMAQNNSSVKTTNHLFDDAIDPEAMICIALADGKGQIANPAQPVHEEFLRERLAIYHETMSNPYVMGRDLMEAGLTPGPEFSEYLAFAHKLRLAGVEKKSALMQTLAMAGKQKKRKT